MSDSDILLAIQNDIMKKIADGFKEVRCVWVKNTCGVNLPVSTFYRKFRSVARQLEAEGVLRHSYNGVFLVCAYWNTILPKKAASEK